MWLLIYAALGAGLAVGSLAEKPWTLWIWLPGTIVGILFTSYCLVTLIADIRDELLDWCPPVTGRVKLLLALMTTAAVCTAASFMFYVIDLLEAIFALPAVVFYTTTLLLALALIGMGILRKKQAWSTSDQKR